MCVPPKPGTCLCTPGPHGAGERLHRGVEQQSVGVRVDEFHSLSEAAAYVPTAVAHRLQTLWDAGVQIVSQLDEQ